MIKFQNITLTILFLFFRFFLNPSLPDISLHIHILCPSLTPAASPSISQYLLRTVLQLAISEQNYYISDLKSIMPRNSELKNNWPVIDSQNLSIQNFVYVFIYPFSFHVYSNIPITSILSQLQTEELMMNNSSQIFIPISKVYPAQSFQ